MAAPLTALRRPLASSRLASVVWSHPEAPVVAVVVAAWVTLGVVHFQDHNAVGGPYSFDAGSWALMVVAMMVPGVLSMGRYVAFNSLWSRRHRTMWLFLGGYVALWVGVAVVANLAVVGVTALLPFEFSPGRATLVAVGVVAVGWQMTPEKSRALRRCHLRPPVRSRGWAADRLAIRGGLTHGWACLGSCWALMALMFVSQHDFHLMVPLTAVVLAERYQRRPDGVIGALVVVMAIGLSLVG